MCNFCLGVWHGQPIGEVIVDGRPELQPQRISIGTIPSRRYQAALGDEIFLDEVELLSVSTALLYLGV